MNFRKTLCSVKKKNDCKETRHVNFVIFENQLLIASSYRFVGCKISSKFALQNWCNPSAKYG